MTDENFQNFEWLEPWHGAAGTPGIPGMEIELQREVGAGHALYQLMSGAVAIARRFDSDDVLFRIQEAENTPVAFAEVHLTWRRLREVDPQFPFTTFYSSFEEWVEKGMKQDHVDWCRIEAESSGSKPAS